jgi:hypothetical protein
MDLKKNIVKIHRSEFWEGTLFFLCFFDFWTPPIQKFFDKSMIKTVFLIFKKFDPQKSKNAKKKRVPSQNSLPGLLDKKI